MATIDVPVELKERLKESAADLINWTEKAAGKGSDFIAEQAPLVVKEVLAWNIWSSVVWIGIAASVWVVLFWFWRYVIKLTKDWEEYTPRGGTSDRTAGRIASFCLAAGWTIVSVLIISTQVMDITKAVVAPRLVILEMLKEVLK